MTDSTVVEDRVTTLDAVLSSRWLVAALCAAGVVMANLSVFRDGMRSVQGDLIDGRLVNYFLEHGYRWMFRQDPLNASLWDAPFFYPIRNAMAYSDVMIGAVPLYAPFRLIGLAPDTSFQLWVISSMVATYWAAYAFVRTVTGLASFPAALSAFIVAFSAARVTQVGHPQLMPQFFGLLALVLAAVALHAPDRRWWRAQILVFLSVICLAAQLYAGVYLGWVTCLAILVAIAGGLLWRRERAQLLAAVSRVWPGVVVGAVAAGILLIPFVLHYRGGAQEFGPRSWKELSCFLPHPMAWLTPDPANWMYGGLSNFLMPSDTPCRNEKWLSFGYVTLAACIAGLVAGRRRPEGRLAAWTFVALVALATTVGTATLWWFVYQMVPGAIAIRAVGRIVLVAMIPASLGLAYLVAMLQAKGRQGLAIGLAVVCILEQGMTAMHYERDEGRIRIERAVAGIPAGCRAFYLTTELPAVQSAITAMWAGLERGVASVNGHSGSWPPGYPFVEPPRDARREVVSRWVVSRGADPADVCFVDVRVHAWLVEARVPQVMVAGRAYAVEVVVENRGKDAWRRNELVRLGASTDVVWGIGRVELPHDVAPGERVRFSFRVVAPNTPGEVPFEWGIVKEGVAWLNADLGIGPIRVLPKDAWAESGEDSAELVSASVPRTMRPGGRYDVTVVVRNTGRRSWRRDHLVRLGSREPDNNLTWGLGRVELPHDVEPGEVVAFAFEVIAPAPGTYRFTWSMVREGVVWVEPVFDAGPVEVVPPS